MTGTVFAAAVLGLFWGALLLLGVLAHRLPRRLLHSGAVYALSLGCFCTARTFYGAAGHAARTGFPFLAIYIGAILGIMGWPLIMPRLLRAKRLHGVTSIADLLAVQYGRSQYVAALATIMAFLATLPYLALQLRALSHSFRVMAAGHLEHSHATTGHADLAIGTGLVVLAVTFGLRSVRTVQPRVGVALAAATTSVLSWGALAVAGLYVTFGIAGGLSGISAWVSAFHAESTRLIPAGGGVSYDAWGCGIVLGMAAILLLPRQFHLAVVENKDERHVRTALWLLPAYLITTVLFILPVAVVGGRLHLPLAETDVLILNLPLLNGQSAIAAVVFLGGLAAATGMVLVTSVSVTTMVSNHIILPFLGAVPLLKRARRHLLLLRWGVVSIWIALAFAFGAYVGEDQYLADMGTLSLAAIVQFVPPIFLGLFWKRGNQAGALLGLAGGALVWIYTLVFPALAGLHGTLATLLNQGPFGVAWLRPQQLLGLGQMDAIAHGVIWSLMINTGLYVLGSFLFPKHEDENHPAPSFAPVTAAGTPDPKEHSGGFNVAIDVKRTALVDVFQAFVTPLQAQAMVDECLRQFDLGEDGHVPLLVLLDVFNAAETLLAGAIGSAAAHKAFGEADLLTPEEYASLSESYSRLLSRLRLPPNRLRRQVDYHQEREGLLAEQVTALEFEIEERKRAERELSEANQQLEASMRQLAENERQLAESEARYREANIHLRASQAALRESEASFRAIIETARDAIFMKDCSKKYVLCNPSMVRLFGTPQSELLGMTDESVWEHGVAEQLAHEDDRVLGGRIAEHEITFSLDGEQRAFHVVKVPLLNTNGDIVGLCGIARDMTAHKTAEREARLRQEQLVQADKMASLGILVSGVAHEINNPNFVIMSSAGTLANLWMALQPALDRQAEANGDLAMGATTYSEMRDYIPQLCKALLDSSDRIKYIVQELRDFARQSPAELTEQVNVNSVVTSAVALVSNMVKKTTTRFSVHYSEDVPAVHGNYRRLEQVVINLIQNACQALPGQERGIRVTTCVEESGREVVIEVEDEGVGIDEAAMPHVCDPFYTTKRESGGTGLGLSISSSIVQEHHGQLLFDSEPGKGTTARIILPAAQPPGHR